MANLKYLMAVFYKQGREEKIENFICKSRIFLSYVFRQSGPVFWRASTSLKNQ